jgi:KAP family P-loop domain
MSAQAPAVSPIDWFIDYTPLRSLPLDQEALRIYEHAYQVGLETEETSDPPVSFTTVLIALLVGEDETSRWFAGLAPENGPKPELVLAEKKKLTNKPVDLRPPRTGKPDNLRLSVDKQLLTESARKVIENAEQWAHRVGGSDIGVRHLVAAYVLNPPANHRAQMQYWKFHEAKWHSEFFAWVAERYTAEQWTDASHRPAPTKAVPSFEQQKVKGAALAFPSDAGASAVLEEASRFHSCRKKDQWLRLQTVFFALIETARTDDALRAAIQPIWNSIQAVEKQYVSARDAWVPTLTPPDPHASFSSVDISPRVLNALETARELAKATRSDANGEFSVGALYLAGALISRRVDGDDHFTSLGVNPQALRLELINYAQTKGESAEVWREALGEEETLQAGRVVDLNSDEPEAVVRLDEEWQSDPLAIRPDVEAFGALLASKSLEPPLSIGLFGPWGSGKTTFLRRLQRAIERRATEAKEAAKKSQATPYVSNVVHVDFNAWHFAEEALTSSLVDTILRALNRYIKDEQEIGGRAWSKVKEEELETTRRKLAAAEAVLNATQTAVTNAETTLAQARSKAAELTTGLHAVVQGVWTATKGALQEVPVVKDSGVLEAVGDTVKSTEELQSKLNSIRTRPARLLSDLGWARSLLFAGLVLVVPPLVGLLVKSVMGTDQAGQIISSITAMITVIGLWARTASKAVSRVDEAIAKVADAYEQKIAEDPNVKAAQKGLDEVQVTAKTAEASVQAAREALAKAQAEAANATLPAQMLHLVSGRLEDQTYNKELTTLSLARADLQALSTILRDGQTVPTPPSDTPPAPGDTATPTLARAVDRVILYIDDLDRCKPEDVVRVLQLVHMLLAFELFVVVVAVDARWVEEALINSYKWLADSDAGATAGGSTNGHPGSHPSAALVTPQDYLEKIFQISFWLEPMTSARAASFLGSLVRTQARESGPVVGVPTTSADPTAASKIEIMGIELDYMRALAAYVGPSPRRVKRLVNAYRLIKARLSNAQLETFLTKGSAEADNLRSGPYQLVIGLLVIGTGAPSSSAQILKELSECDPTSKLDQVVERFRSRNHPDWTMAAQVIETLMRTQKTNDVSELRGWARKVGRFLLNAPTAFQASGRQPPPTSVAPLSKAATP